MASAGEPTDMETAIRAGQCDRLAAILDASPDLVNEPVVGGWPPLHLAAEAGQVEAGLLLLERGADPLLRSPNQASAQPLHRAVGSRQRRTAALLLEHGANPNALAAGRSPLDLARAHQDDILIRMLLNHGAADRD